MIVGIGIDSIEIERFEHWKTYSRTMLERVFSHHEIEYCLHTPKKSAERFAARFAAREAFYKAARAMNAEISIPFLTICKKISVQQSKYGLYFLHSDWHTLCKNMHYNSASIRAHLSLTHNRTTALAIIMLEDGS